MGLLLVIALATLLGIVYYDRAKDWMLSEIIDYINASEYGDLHVEEMEVAIFHQLPSISVKLSGLTFYEQKDSLRSKDQSPIISAANAYIALDSWELLRNKKLMVTNLSIAQATLDLMVYEDGKTNLEKALTRPEAPRKDKTNETIALAKPSKEPSARVEDVRKDSQQTRASDQQQSRTHKAKEETPAQTQTLEVRLESIHLKNALLKYSNPSKGNSSELTIPSLDGAIVIDDQGLSVDLGSTFEITKSNSFPTLTDLGQASLQLDIKYYEADKNLEIRQGALGFENIVVDIHGSYRHTDGNFIDLNFDASSNDVALLSKLIQEDIVKKNTASIEKAGLFIKASAKGRMEDQIPNIQVSFGVEDLNLTDVAGNHKFSNIGFNGTFRSGQSADWSQAHITIENLRGQTPGGGVSGRIAIRNFQRPYLNSSLAATLNLKDLDNIFKLPKIDSLQGKVNLKTDFDGVLNFEQEHEMDSIGSWSIDLQEISFKYLPSQKYIKGLSGLISESANEVVVDSLSVFYDQSNIVLKGRLKNLYHFLFKKEQNIEAEVELISKEISTSQFIFNPDGTPQIDDRISNLNIKAKIVGKDNDLYNSYFPAFRAKLQHFSFDLDSLPGIENLQGIIEFHESEEGYNFQLSDTRATLPIGSIGLEGDVLFPLDFKTLTTRMMINLDEVPVEYALDLIDDLKDVDGLDTAELNPEQMNSVTGDVYISTIMELVPFAVPKGEMKAQSLTLSMPDSSYYDIKNLNISLDSLHFIHNPESSGIKGIAHTKGEFHVDEFNTPVISDFPLDFSFLVVEDIIDVRFSTLRDSVMLDAGTLSLDISEQPYRLDATYSLKGIDLESVISDYTTERLVEGSIDALLEFNGFGTNIEDLISSLKGNIKFRGDSLMLYGIDLDDLLRRYKRSQQFNLADISAFVMAGPMGAAVTKGADFTSLLNVDLKPDQKTSVSQAVIDWNFDKGIFSTRDVAFSTRDNRLAFEGSLDFVRDTIPGFTVYVVDKKGCSLMEQQLYGRFGNIEMGELKIAKTLLGSIINLVKSVVGKKCKVVYSGKVAHPITK